MASNAFANVAAAQAGGYVLVQSDRGPGVSAPERFFSSLEKFVGGISGDPATPIRAYGYGATQVAADAVALASLNAQRDNRYGADSAAQSSSVHAIAPNAVGGSSAASTAATAGARHTKDAT